jgi:hypothetical protein
MTTRPCPRPDQGGEPEPTAHAENPRILVSFAIKMIIISAYHYSER